MGAQCSSIRHQDQQEEDDSSVIVNEDRSEETETPEDSAKAPSLDEAGRRNSLYHGHARCAFCKKAANENHPDIIHYEGLYLHPSMCFFRFFCFLNLFTFSRCILSLFYSFLNTLGFPMEAVDGFRVHYYSVVISKRTVFISAASTNLPLQYPHPFRPLQMLQV